MGCINTVTSKPRQQEKIVSGARVRRGLHRGAGASAPADEGEAGLAILKHSYDCPTGRCASAGWRIRMMERCPKYLFDELQIFRTIEFCASPQIGLKPLDALRFIDDAIALLSNNGLPFLSLTRTSRS